MFRAIEWGFPQICLFRIEGSDLITGASKCTARQLWRAEGFLIKEVAPVGLPWLLLHEDPFIGEGGFCSVAKMGCSSSMHAFLEGSLAEMGGGLYSPVDNFMEEVAHSL